MSNVGTKMRKFVNVVMQHYRDELCSLGRIKASDLFYASTEEAEQAAKNAMAAGPCTKTMILSPLPKPRIKFDTSRSADGSMDFMPFHGANNGSSKILCLDAAGQAVLYDAGSATASVETLPRLHEPKNREPLALSVARPGGAHDPAHTDALYVMDGSRGSFEALVYGDPTPASPYQYRVARCPDLYAWHWRRLPAAPYASGFGTVQSYALLDGDTICVLSGVTENFGTHFFNTATEQWTKAGSWILPFYGRAHTVPELNNLVFGMENRWPYHLCALDFSSISMDRPPRLRYHTGRTWTSPRAGSCRMSAWRTWGRAGFASPKPLTLLPCSTVWRWFAKMEEEDPNPNSE